MSKEFTDPDTIEPATDTRVEHNSEVFVAIRTVQQSQLQINLLADQKANINIGYCVSVTVTLHSARCCRWRYSFTRCQAADCLVQLVLVENPDPVLSQQGGGDAAGNYRLAAETAVVDLSTTAGWAGFG